LHAFQCRRADLPFGQGKGLGRQRGERFRGRDRALKQRLRLDDVMDEAARDGLGRRIGRTAEDRVREKTAARRRST